MKACIDHNHYRARINRASLQPTRLSRALCGASRVLDRLARWHTRRTLRRQAAQELGALPNEILKDIGLRRGDIGNLAEELADRARPCR